MKRIFRSLYAICRKDAPDKQASYTSWLATRENYGDLVLTGPRRNTVFGSAGMSDEKSFFYSMEAGYVYTYSHVFLPIVSFDERNHYSIK